MPTPVDVRRSQDPDKRLLDIKGCRSGCEESAVTAPSTFGHFTHFVDEHLHIVRAGVLIAGLTGVLLIGRSVRLMKTFYTVSDIPEEFISKQMRLRGKVKGHGRDHLHVEHLPIVKKTTLGRGLKGEKKGKKSSLPIYLAGVDLSVADMAHVVNMAPVGSLLWFRMLSVNKEQGLECIVSQRKNFLRSLILNEQLVRQGLATVRPPDPSQELSPAAVRLMQQLFKAELYAEEKAKGIWARLSLVERLRERATATRDSARDRVQRGVRTITKPWTVSASVVKSVGARIRGLWRSKGQSR
ncbi:protein C3orf33-like [Diadema antillarum]|uniref:protein C3orf33-like n=1 Tax=Diadema antillarum TaxID=105358 RepID=UPI003A844321